jgi:hypothetical protein
MIDYILSLIYPNTASILSGFIKVIDRLEAHHARSASRKDATYQQSREIKDIAQAKADKIVGKAEGKAYDLVVASIEHANEAEVALKSANKLREALGIPRG